MKGFGLVPRGRRQWRAFVLRWTAASIAVIGVIVTMIRMPGESYSGPFRPLSAEEAVVRDDLRRHVSVLAGAIGERNIWRYEALEASAGYVARVLGDRGYPVAVQEFREQGITVKNVEAERRGESSPEEVVLLGAHYDSVVGSPGANDNASGIAALLEMARLLADQSLPRTVRFVAFVNEEPPFFQRGGMGSRVYASRARQRGERIVAMLSIETIGYYSDEAGSQHYPFPLSLFYPNRANFIGFVGNLASRDLVRHAIGTFRAHTDFPSEGIAAPEWIGGIGWSDHASFWHEGYPALMITDTALFRYRHYHTREDTPDKLDYARMARVVMGIAGVAVELARRDGG